MSGQPQTTNNTASYFAKKVMAVLYDGKNYDECLKVFNHGDGKNKRTNTWELGCYVRLFGDGSKGVVVGNKSVVEPMYIVNDMGEVRVMTVEAFNMEYENV